MRFFVLLLISICLLTVCASTESNACTTAIISGKCTTDGRPLLFKHRDTGFFQNKLMFFDDGTYKYIGLVNSADIEGKEIWSGSNSAGFSIMNSASYNLNINDTTKLKDQEGIIMKEALRSCATLEDFEEFLNNWPKPMGVESNFGVIDAQGGAAYYETTNFSFKKIDANDPTVAPFGYVIRTNYSFTGTPDDGYGYIRYLTANRLFYNAVGQNTLNYKFLLQRVSRSLYHSLLNLDLAQIPWRSEDEMHFVAFEDYIPRRTSVTTMVIQGIKKDEPVELTTIWTVLGFPLCSVAIPTWVSGGTEIPSLLKADHTGNAPLCQMALDLKEKCFPLKRGSGKRYINLAALLNQNHNGIMQKLPELEDRLIGEAESYLADWRSSGIKPKEVKELYGIVSEKIKRYYSENFDL